MAQTRKFGALETKLIPPVVCNVVVPVQLKLEKPLDINLLEASVSHLVKVQPNLQCGLDRENNAFLPLSEFGDIFEVMDGSSHWKDTCLKYSKELLREDHAKSVPLKVFYFPTSNTSSSMVVVYAHLVGDGTNGMTMVNDILAAYSSLRHGYILDETILPCALSVEDMVKHTLSLKQQEEFSELAVNHTKRCISQFNCYMQKTNSNPPATEALYYTSSVESYEKFIKLCKKRKVTVGAALIAAYYFGYASCMFDVERYYCGEELVVGCNIPFNMRGRVNDSIQPNNVNLSVTQNIIKQSVKRSTKFWELAALVRKDLVYMIESGIAFYDLVTNKELQEGSIKDNVKEHGVNQQLCVSNMGRYPSSVDYVDCSIESMHCVGGLWIHNWDVMELMVYSTNKFNLSVIYAHGEENKLRANHVLDVVKKIIEKVANFQETFDLNDCIN